ncbi:hypothetical protein [Stieleria sedimenti]|uniref:hypothetical protein n=1 Tax=Stieleria sedimenti TaxID=2976331 RepID=UPI002180772E|nr:hypothetical protein [Stieleria sedimenti]
MTAALIGGYFGFYGLDLTVADATEPGKNPAKTLKHRRISNVGKRFAGIVSCPPFLKRGVGAFNATDDGFWVNRLRKLLHFEHPSASGRCTAAPRCSIHRAPIAGMTQKSLLIMLCDLRRT